MACTCSEVSNRSLDTRFEVEAIAAAIMLHICESWHKREVDVQSMELEFMIGGVLTLASEKTFDKKSMIKFDCRQRMNLSGLTIITQSLLKLKKRKVDNSKHITTMKHPVKTVFCALH